MTPWLQAGFEWKECDLSPEAVRLGEVFIPIYSLGFEMKIDKKKEVIKVDLVAELNGGG